LTIATQITYPSFGYEFNNPYEEATTLWEVFNAPHNGPLGDSRNHIMFGSIGSWFYRYIGGIKPNALEDLEISPSPVGPDSPVNKATVTYNSVKGVIGVNWQKTKQSFAMDVIIPSATTARVILPKHEYFYKILTINGKTVADFTGEKSRYFISSSKGVDDIKFLPDGSVQMNVQPGKYSFFALI